MASLITSPAPPRIHAVVAGDTLRALAKRYYDNEALWTRIYEANLDSVTDPEILTVGQQLVIPAR